jgi:hypothetical protein
MQPSGSPGWVYGQQGSDAMDFKELLAGQAQAIQQVAAFHHEIQQVVMFHEEMMRGLQVQAISSRQEVSASSQVEANANPSTKNGSSPKSSSTQSRSTEALTSQLKADLCSVPEATPTNGNSNPQRHEIQRQFPMDGASLEADGRQGLAAPLLQLAGDSPAADTETAIKKASSPHHVLRKSQNTSSRFLDNINPFSPQTSEIPAARQEFFPNVERMKLQLIEKLHKAQSHAEDSYAPTGFFADLARNDRFQNAAFVIIALNVLWISIDVDQNKALVLCNAPLPFQLVNNAFCLAFTIEIFVRFMAYKCKEDCIRDGWFVFDAVLVALMIWETWIEVAIYLLMGHASENSYAMQVVRLFRVLRLTRIARLARVLRQIPELSILLKGMVMAMRAVGAILLLLVAIIYVFAILFTQQLSGTEAGEGCFENVPQAAHCLMINGVFSEQHEFIQKMLDADWTYYVTILLYLLLASTTVMNMLIAILCEVMAVTAQVEHAEIGVESVKAVINRLIPHASGPSQIVTRKDFVALMERPDAIESFAREGIDVLALLDCAPVIFKEHHAIPVAEFIESLLQFRGENKATVKDLVNMRVSVTTFLGHFEDRMDRRLLTLRDGQKSLLESPMFFRQDSSATSGP